MPPKKEVKEKQIKGDEAEELVLEYLKGMNRPFASTDVSANLKNKVNKANAQKVMQALADRGSLSVKPYGKQTIFVYNQDLLPVASTEDLAGLDEELKNIKAEIEEKKKELKDLTTELTAKLALPPTKELGMRIKQIKAENDATLGALLPYRGEAGAEGAVQPMSDEDIKKIDQDFQRWRKEWTGRRGVYKTLLGMMEEGGQILDTPTFEEDQGINRDDEEAKELEEGEFCKPQPNIRKPIAKKPTGPPSKPPSAKRENAPDSQDAPPKKKAKKAKA